MRFPTQIPSPRVLFSRFDCPIWVVAFFFLSLWLLLRFSNQDFCRRLYLAQTASPRRAYTNIPEWLPPALEKIFLTPHV